MDHEENRIAVPLNRQYTIEEIKKALAKAGIELIASEPLEFGDRPVWLFTAADPYRMMGYLVNFGLEVFIAHESIWFRQRPKRTLAEAA